MLTIKVFLLGDYFNMHLSEPFPLQVYYHFLSRDQIIIQL